MAYKGHVVVALVVMCLSSGCWARVSEPAEVKKNDVTDDVGPTYFQESDNMDFGVIIDAGSTHTTMYIFKWPARLSSVVLSEVQWLEVQDGDTKIMVREALQMPRPEVRDTITEMLDKAQELIPSQRHSRTIVFVKTTGLMAQMKREELVFLLNDIRDVAGTFPFEFHWAWAGVLSALDTAVFNWISTNYLGEYLQEKRQEVGTIELGSGSLRIAYEPDEGFGVLSHKQGGYNITLAGDRYELYAKGDKAMGHTSMYTTVKDAAVLQALDSGMVKENGSSIVNFPCFLKGCHQEHTFRGLTYVLVGVGDLDSCVKLTNDNVDIKSLNPVNEPIPDTDRLPDFNVKTFYAGGAMYHAAKRAGVAGRQSLSDFYSAADEYCSAKWSKALKEANDPRSEEYLRQTCFSLSATYAILRTGMQITQDSQQVVFTSTLKGHSTGWQLGMILYYEDLQPIDYESLFVENAGTHWATYIFLAIITLVVITLALLTSVVVRKMIQLGKMDARAVSYFDDKYEVDVQVVDPLMDPVDFKDKQYA